MKFKKIVISVLLAALALSGCGENNQTRDSVSLWCLESEPALNELNKLVSQYNSKRGRDVLPVSVRTFPDEISLAAGFDTMRPDILLCSENKAQELSGLGLTKDISTHLSLPCPSYYSYITERIPEAGLDIFPLGGDIQLLCTKKDCFSLSERNDLSIKFICSEAEKYAEEKGLPFFTAQSFSNLIYDAMLEEGREFHALKDYDIKHEEYRSIYNLLASAAYSGGLISSEYSPCQLLRASYLPCAFVKSSSLSDFPTEDYSLFMPFEAESCLSQISCFAVTIREGRDKSSAAAFLSWLFEGANFSSLSVKSGLVPSFQISDYAASSSFEALLIKLSTSSKLHLPEKNSDFLLNQLEFEQSFRQAIGLFD